MEDLLDFANVPQLGTVVRVDPRRIDVSLREAAFGVTMDDLVALPIGDAFLIGLVEVLEGTVRAAAEQPPRQDASAGVIVRIMPMPRALQTAATGESRCDPIPPMPARSMPRVTATPRAQ